MAEAVLVGSNLAVLVTAVELGSAGREVSLLTDGRPLGGHFRGLRIEDVDLDIGMVLVESGGPPTGPAPDLAGYQPGVRYDWTRFTAVVDDWLQRQVPLVRTPTPEVLVGGRRWPDHLLSDRLDVLATGDLRGPGPLPRSDPRHASAKIRSRRYDTLTYRDAALLNHGPDVHDRLVAPFVDKVLGERQDGLLARYHRAAWLPLFWPETVTAACNGQPTGLPEHPFWTTSSGFVGGLVRVLERRIEELPTVTVHRDPIRALSPATGGRDVSLRDGSRWECVQPALGLGHDRVQELLGLPRHERPPGASVTLVCGLVRSSAIGAPVGCLSVVDHDFRTYRITDQDVLAGADPEWHRVVLEAGAPASAGPFVGDDVAIELVGELRRLLEIPEGADAVRVLKILYARDAIPVPTVDTVAADVLAHDRLAEAWPSATLTGALLGHGATSMNDQVVQGLAAAQRLR